MALAGLELIISTVCNATFCEPVYDNPVTDNPFSKKRNEILKLGNDLNGKTLKVVTLTNFPLSWTELDDNGTITGHGVAFTILDILKKRFNFTYDIVVPDENYEIGGKSPNHSVIGLLNSSQADMAAVFLPKLIRFQRLVSFSIELDEGVWTMMLKRPKASAAGSGLMAPFNGFVWYLTLAAVLCYGPCVTFLTRLRSKLLHDDERHLPLSPSFWFVYSAFIKQGTNLAPEASIVIVSTNPHLASVVDYGPPSLPVREGPVSQQWERSGLMMYTTRILFATWWMFIILLSAFYTANLTAFLTLSKFTLDIETPEDLYKKNYRWVTVEGGSVQYSLKTPSDPIYFLNKMVSSGLAEFLNVPSDFDYLPLVNGGAVLVKETVALDHLMYGDYMSKAKQGVNEVDRCTYVVAPKPFMKKHRAFAYPLGSPLKELFDTILIHVLQAGLIDYLIHKDLPTTKICPLDLQSKDRQLRNSDLIMTYMIMVTGLCAAAAIFVGEVLIKRYVNKKINKEEQVKPKLKRHRSKKLSKRLEDDDGRPPPYDSLFGNTKYNLNENSKRKIVNGREYYEYKSSNGDTRLIPVRAPSAFLYR